MVAVSLGRKLEGHERILTILLVHRQFQEAGMRALAVTAALIGAVWATVSAQGAGDRDQFFKGQGRWMPTHHSLKGMRGRHPKWSSGSFDTLTTWSSFFVADGVDSDGLPKSNLPFTMVGQLPIGP